MPQCKHCQALNGIDSNTCNRCGCNLKEITEEHDGSIVNNAKSNNYAGSEQVDDVKSSALCHFSAEIPSCIMD